MLFILCLHIQLIVISKIHIFSIDSLYRIESIDYLFIQHNFILQLFSVKKNTTFISQAKTISNGCVVCKKTNLIKSYQ